MNTSRKAWKTECERLVESAVSHMEGLGAQVVETSLPSASYALACYYILAPSECSANLARYDGVKYGYSYRDTDSMWEAMEKTRQHGIRPGGQEAHHVGGIRPVRRVLRRLLS